MKLITLTTDFGLDDWFVGSMKGVIQRLAPNAKVIDLTHGIAPGDIVDGAFALGIDSFPPERSMWQSSIQVWPEPVSTKTALRGEIVYIDRFGNAITNLPASRVLASKVSKVTVRGKSVPILECYADVARGKPVAVIGSTGLLEIAINGGSAAKLLKLKRGSKVLLGEPTTR